MAIKRHYAVEVTDGLQVSVSDRGPSEPDGTVLLLHSWALTSHAWDEVSDQIGYIAPSLRVLAYDGRGHGESHSDFGDLAALADDLAAVIERLIPKGPLVIVGHAMGGATLLALARRHPDLVESRVDGAVFVATGVGPIVPLDGRSRALGVVAKVNQEVLKRGVLSRIPEPVLRQAVRFVGGRGVGQRVLDETIGQAAATDPGAAATLLTSLLEEDFRDAVAEFDGKQVAVISGTADRLVPAARSRQLSDALNGARYVPIAGAGHLVPLERPHDVAAIVGGVMVGVLGSGWARLGTARGCRS